MDLYFDGLESVGDLFYEALAEVCSDVVELYIRTLHPVAVSKDATLESLAHLAKHCRLIEYITIRLDCSLSFPETPENWQSFNDSLVSLDMGMSPINKPGWVEGTMCHLFRVSTPNIISETCRFGYGKTLDSENVPDNGAQTAIAEPWDEVATNLADARTLLDSEQTHQLYREEADELRAKAESLQTRVQDLETEIAGLRASTVHAIEEAKDVHMEGDEDRKVRQSK